MVIRRAVVAFIAVVSVSVLAEPEEFALPRFKWGQTKDKVFITIVAKELDYASIQLDFAEDGLHFAASDTNGKLYRLDLNLVQDLDPAGCRFENLQRPDRHGEGVVATLVKRFPTAWDALVTEPRKFSKVMDRDWAKEDPHLEQDQDDAYFGEHKKYLRALTMNDLERARKDTHALVLSVRHSACEQCKVADDTFAKVAKQINKAKKTSWKSNIRLAVVDARTQRGFARFLKASCARSPIECQLFVLAPGGDTEAVRIRARHDDGLLLNDLERLAREQFAPISADAAKQGRIGKSRGLVVVAPNASPQVTSIVHRVRLRMDVSVADGESAASELGISNPSIVVAWMPGETEARIFTDSLDSLQHWLLVRSVPLLGNVSAYEEDEPYAEIGLPVARLYIDRGPVDVEAYAVVRDLANSYVGRVLFIARNATSKAHDWRQHGLPPDQFPSFAYGKSMVHNCTKYAFLGGPSNAQENLEFWKGPSVNASLRLFLEQSMTGQLEPSLMSDPPPMAGVDVSSESEGPKVVVKKLVGRTCRAGVEASDTEALIEGYDEWRRDHPRRTMQLDILAPLLATWNITVYRLDMGYNECPHDVLPLLSAGYSGYWFIAPQAKERGLKAQKLKKLDPPFDRVMQFVAKHTKSKLDASAILAEFEAIISQNDSVQARKEWAAQWGKTVSIVIGLVGVLVFFGIRLRSKRRDRRAAASTGSSSATSDGAASLTSKN